jgi:hypothetical protein
VDPGEKGSHLGSQGAQPARRGKRRAVGLRQWRRTDLAGWPKTQEMGSPHLQEMFMHRVSDIVHCVAVYVQYNHNRKHVSLYYLFQENKSFGTDHHLHSSSDVREVVSSTVIFGTRKIENFTLILKCLCLHNALRKQIFKKVFREFCFNDCFFIHIFLGAFCY